MQQLASKMFTKIQAPGIYTLYIPFHIVLSAA